MTGQRTAGRSGVVAEHQELVEDRIDVPADGTAVAAAATTASTQVANTDERTRALRP